MPALGLGIGIPFRRMGAGIDAQAQAHYNRVIADGGLIPSGLDGVNNFFKTVKGIYGTSDITTAISVGLDAQVLGYKLGAGAGTTAGQAAQKLYSVKSTENLLLHSEDFSNAYYTSNLGTLLTNQTTAPNGTLTADLFTKTSGVNTVSQIQTSSSPYLSTGIHTYSIYIKQNVGNSVLLRLDSSGNTANFTFNFTTKTFTNSGVNAISSSFDELPNGWFRLKVTGNVAASGWLISICNLFSNPTNDSFFIWGAQLNTGSVALPYTPTTTTAETLADVVQTTAASQPLLLVHSGANYWFGSRVAQNYCSTSITVLSSTTTDFEIKAQINLQNYSSNDYSIVGQYLAGNNNFLLYIRNGILEIYFVVAGTGYNYNSTVAVGFTNNTDGYIKVTRDSATGAVKYYISTDGSTYTQLGATVSGVNGAITPPTTAALEVGMYANINGAFQGKIYRVTISNTIGGEPVVDFNPNQYNAATSQTQWTSSTGEIWSIQTGTATTGYKGALVSKTIVQSDGVDDTMQSGTITSRTNFTRYFAFNTLVASGTQYFIDGDVSNRHLIYKGSSQVRLYNDGTGAGEILNANTVGLKLITGDYNTATSKLRTNAGSDTNGSTGNASSTKVTLFGAGSGGTNSNIIVTTSIDAIAVSNNTQKTAMYNYIRSINGSAF
jgi:hypothetical protein